MFFIFHTEIYPIFFLHFLLCYSISCQDEKLVVFTALAFACKLEGNFHKIIYKSVVIETCNAVVWFNTKVFLSLLLF